MPEPLPHRVIRLRAAFRQRGGALYQPGECAAFPADLAARLVAAHLAEDVEETAEDTDEEDAPMPAQPAKRGPGRPPKDKMVHRSPFVKGGRQ